MTKSHRAAIYARISEDDDQLEAGVNRQIDDATARAAQQGWSVVAVYQDNDISALNGKRRPGYEALMADVDAGRVDRIVVYQTSRLWRNRRERADGIERLQRAQGIVSSVKGPELDCSTAYGRGMAGMLGEFDTMESEVKGERVARKALERAENGDPNGAVPYGWQRVIDTNDRGVRTGAHDVHHPEEAPVVLEICRRLLTGETLRSVTQWLNDSGTPAPGAKFKIRNRERGRTNPDGMVWGHTAVRKLALRATNAGLRWYHQGQPDERLLPMKAEPIITRDEWERLRVMFAPQREVSRPGGRKHLLTGGIGSCGICGGPLRVVNKRGRGQIQTLYICELRECVGRKKERVDELVRAVVIERLMAEDARDLLITDDQRANDAMARAEALRARLDGAADDYAEGLITREQLRRITARLEPQIKEADHEARTARPDVPLELLGDLIGDRAEQRWDMLDVNQQRLVLGVLIDEVRIDRARKGPGFDPATVAIVWAER